MVGATAASALGLPHNRPQRRPVQMVEVSVGDQNQIDRGQVAYLQARSSQAFEHEQPAGKIGIDENVLAADLEKETGMADESHTHLAVADQFGLWVRPVRGVTAESRTRLPNCRARLRSAEFFKVFFSIKGRPGRDRMDMSSNFSNIRRYLILSTTQAIPLLTRSQVADSSSQEYFRLKPVHPRRLP